MTQQRKTKFRGNFWAMLVYNIYATDAIWQTKKGMEKLPLKMFFTSLKAVKISFIKHEKCEALQYFFHIPPQQLCWYATLAE